MTQRLDWQTESLRFSFLGCTDTAAELVTWEKITGREADSVTVKKSQGLRNEDGAWENGHLIVSAQPGRVDVVMNPLQQPTPGDVPHLGDVTIVANKLLERLIAMKMPQCARLGVGVKLNHPTGGAAETIDALNKFLPFLSVNRENHDVVFQENKLKKLKHSGVILNRLYKWSQVRLQFVQITVGSDGSQQLNPNGPAEFKHVLQLELDFNTAPHATLPHPDSYPPLVKEMFESLRQAVDSQGD